MKAMRAHQFGGPEILRLEDAPDPQVQAGQVQIRVRAAGINPADLVRLAGRLQPLALPYIPGTDVCGEVEAVGAGVTHVKPGDRVFGRAFAGGYAEKTCLTANETVALPANLSWEEGAAIPIPFFTAYRALYHKAARPRPLRLPLALVQGRGTKGEGPSVHARWQREAICLPT